MRQLAILSVAILGLAACARSGDPAPVVFGEGDGSRDRAVATSANAGDAAVLAGQAGRELPRAGPGVHTVARGESVWGLAERYNVPRQALIAANDLRSPYRLEVGQRLRIPAARWHAVRKGDTVYDIARLHQVPIRAIIEANELEPPYLLRVGQRVYVPAPRRYEVARGDTLYGISRAHGVDMRELARMNGLASPYTLTPGQVLLIPASGRSQAEVQTAAVETARTTATDAAPSSVSTDTARPKAAAPDTASRSGSGTTTAGLPPKPPVRPAGLAATTAPKRPKAIPEPPARGGSRFAWPLRGEVLARYGPQDGGLHNDGINIAARHGAPIKAAENGVVAYTGNELRGFGQLLLIKHADNWVTAYAHCSEILVRRGARVARGQTVARVGNSGGVTRPQLHFEVRRGTKAVDPLTVLAQLEARLRGE